MADIKISALTSVEEVQSTDVVPVVSGSATMKASASQIKDYINGDLDYTDSATAGSYVTAVSESNGVVNVTKEAADTTPTEDSTKMITSGGVKTALDDKVDWDDLSEVGAVNYLPNKATSGGTSPATYTVDANKIITVTIASTLSATAAIDINTGFVLKAGTYRLSGCPSGVGDNNKLRLHLYNKDVSPATLVKYDDGSGATFTLNSDTTLSCQIRCGSGLEAGTYVFKPMLTDPSYNGPYVPYAKTNRELTDVINGSYIITNIRASVSVTADGIKTYKTLLNELASAFLTTMQQLGRGETAEVIGITDNGDMGYMPCIDNAFFANNATSAKVSGAKCSAGSDTTAAIMSMTAHTTLANVYAGKTNTASTGNTYTDYRSIVPASGKVFSIYYRSFRFV